MNLRPLIVLTLDGLSTSALGCYGSSWNTTPAIDAIASTGCVWDRCIATTDDPIELLRPMMKTAGSGGWTEAWRGQGRVEMITDVAGPSWIDDSGFDHVERIPTSPGEQEESPVDDIAESQLGRLIAAAVERDGNDDPWSVLWLHSDFLTRRWDAPRDLFPSELDDWESEEPSDEVELLEVESDVHSPPLEGVPELFDQVRPPSLRLTDQSHPDLSVSWMRTYGCQVRLVDMLMEVLLHSIQATDPIVVVMGTGGYRLGQGGEIGYRPDTIRSPDIRLPLIVSECGPLRVPHLVSSNVLASILAGLSDTQQTLVDPLRWQQSVAEQEVVTESARASYAVSTPDWFFVTDGDGSEHLYLKPDDVEDFNDVARLRGDITSHLRRDPGT